MTAQALPDNELTQVQDLRTGDLLKNTKGKRQQVLPT